MEFCENCKNYLFLKEQKINDKRTLYYYCKCCEFQKECDNNKISFKRYKFEEQKTDENNHMNKYKTNDMTLPRKSTKCPKCKKTNNNVYEVKYLNNCYNLNMICSNSTCHHNWYL